MFRIVCKSIHSFSTTSKPHILFIRDLSSSSINSQKYAKQESFTVAYLINQFGFSLEKSVRASKNVRFQNRDKPDAVVSFFRNQQFSDTQIRKLISVRCRILIRNPQKIFLPKIEFFRSKGVSSTDLAKIIVCNPNLLESSLNNHILPAFKFFRDLFGCDESVVYLLKVKPGLFSAVEYKVKPNIEVLSQAGVLPSSIVYLLKVQPFLFLHYPDKLKESIDQVQKMGMDPHRCSYNLALSFLTITPRSKWNEKMEAYKRWGCSEDEVLTSFKILPWIMTLSEKKINGIMSFCVNEMGWKPSEVVTNYFMLTLSLNKRILPRWSVYKELLSKRLVIGNVKKNMFQVKEDLFLEKYVNRYKDDAPSLLKLYLEKLEASK